MPNPITQRLALLTQPVMSVVSSIKTLTSHSSPIDGYVYIPFARDEISEDVLADANKFIASSASPFTRKNLKLFCYGDRDLSTLPPDSKIYVMSHGLDISPDKKFSALFDSPTVVNTPELQTLQYSDWAYSIWGGKKVISIDTVANRMINDGILGLKKPTIKLWICDPNCKAEAIAKKFISHFKDKDIQMKVDYYLNHSLTYHCIMPDMREAGMHRWAINNSTESIVRASSIRQSLFNFNNPPAQNENNFNEEINNPSLSQEHGSQV
jgi:hypothetical protein